MQTFISHVQKRAGEEQVGIVGKAHIATDSRGGVLDKNVSKMVDASRR